MTKSKIRLIHEIIMMCLALIVAAIAIIQLTIKVSASINSIFYYIDRTIYWIFLIDYFSRLIISKNKWEFIKNNKIDLLIIIPFEMFLKFFAAIKIIKVTKIVKFAIVIRATIYINTFIKKIMLFFRTKIFFSLVLITLILIFSSAALIAIIEELSFKDALWWSFVTATSVGYGDISPKTEIGRTVAVVLMLTGVGFMGVLSGTVASYFLKLDGNKSKVNYKEELIDNIKIKLDNFNNLSNSDIEDICDILRALKKNDD